ncbi:MAG: SPFH domain-containing protein [Armatimonadota bacterium]
MTVVLVSAGVTLLVFAALMFVARCYRKAGPNEALVVYGGAGKPQIIVGGGGFVWPVINEWATLSLEPFGLDWNPVTGKTKDGVVVTLDGVSQLKVDSRPEALEVAAELLLHKSPEEVAAVARGAVNDGILRFINEHTAQELQALVGRVEMNARAAQAVDERLRSLGLRLVSMDVEEADFEKP